MRTLELVRNDAPKLAADTYSGLLHLIDTHQAHVAVIGQGYVGLPLAMAFADAGFTVSGIDVDRDRIEGLQRCESITPDVTSDMLKRLSDSGNYRATTDYSQLADHDVILICVPTPLRKSKDPDISYVLKPRSAWRRICALVNSSFWNRPPTRALRKSCCCRCSKSAASRRVKISSSPSRPSASIPATRSSQCVRSPRSPAG